jgi:outer membrane protein TolC
MHTQKFIIYLGISIALPVFLLGQTISLTLSECLEQAWQHSQLLKSQDENIEASRAAEQAAQALYYPHLFAEAGHSQLFFPPFNYRQQFASITIDWSPGDWIKKTAHAAVKNIEVQQMEKQQITLDLLGQVSALYIGILSSQQKTIVLEERLQILANHLQVAHALWQGGLRTELDVLQTRATINSVLEEKNIQETETDNLETALLYLLGQPPTGKLGLQDIPGSIIEVQPDSTQKSFDQNPLLQSLQLQAEREQLRLQNVQATKWPLVQLQGGYVVDRDPTAEGNYWQAGVAIQIPLFRWGETKYLSQEVQAHVRALQWQKAQAERETKIQLKQLSNKLKQLRSNYDLQRERLQITNQTLQIAEVNYQAGLITNLEYLDAQKENVITQVTINETRLAYVLGLIENYALANQPEKIKQLQGAQ